MPKQNQRTTGSLSLTLKICWIKTHLEIQEPSMLYKLSLIQKHQEQIWPCQENGQGQPEGHHLKVFNLFSLWSFATSFKIISLKSDFIQFISWFYTCIYPWGRGWQALGDKNMMSTGTFCHRSFVASLKKNLFKSDFIQYFFHVFIHANRPGAEADSPQRTKFWCQQKCLVTSFISCKFQKNVFEVWFYTFFFMI